MQRTLLSSGLLALAVSLSACGGAAVATPDAGDGPASGTCLEGTPDCDDTGIVDDDASGEAGRLAGICGSEVTGCDDPPGQIEPVGDVVDGETAIGQAQELLGRAEGELAPDVRVARRGEEQMMLTEDYVLGRMTVELDPDDTDDWYVTAVTVELPDGPQTFTRNLS